jgi:hypothetical protein
VPMLGAGAGICCCDAARPVELDVYLPDVVCTLHAVARAGHSECQSPRIRARRQDGKSAFAIAAAQRAQACRGACSEALPALGLRVAEGVAAQWLQYAETALGAKLEA